MAELFDDRLCALGEGPLWHPERAELFWFDILGRKLLSKRREWSFDTAHSAAAWIDEDRLLVASEHGLSMLDVVSGAREHVCTIEADNAATRSNDGRADPHGGFWIGTMGWNAEIGVGSIYRYYRGELRRLYGRITISNSICFSPDGGLAYFADTKTSTIQRVRLDSAGWPTGAPEAFARDATGCDGAICDGEGYVWSARWGEGRIVRLTPEGMVDHVEHVPAPQVTCPALTPEGVLYATSAHEGMDATARTSAPLSGATFQICSGVPGRSEPKVIL